MARVVLLGSKGGPAIRSGGPSPTASLLEVSGRPLVIDCGLGVTRGFVEAGHSLVNLGVIFITHHHSDHNLEFGNLIHTAWTAGLKTRVTAFGPAGLARMWQDFLALNRFDIATRQVDEGRIPLSTLVEVKEFADGLVMQQDGLTVTALRNNHPPVIDSFALRFDFTDEAGQSRRVVFSGDTTAIPEMVDFAAGADVLVHEAMYGPGVEALVARVPNSSRLREHLLASHALAEDVGRIATEAGVRHLVLNHLVPADDPAVTPAHYEQATRTTYAGRLTIGRDGLAVAVG